MNGKGSTRRPEDNKKYRDEHERIFNKPLEVEILEDFLDADSEAAQVDVEEFIKGRTRNED